MIIRTVWQCCVSLHFPCLLPPPSYDSLFRHSVNLFLKDRHFFKPSPLNQLLFEGQGNSSNEPPVMPPLECFAPQFPASIITEVLALSTLVVRSIEKLMEQQRELMKRFPPLGQSGGCEVTCKWGVIEVYKRCVCVCAVYVCNIQRSLLVSLFSGDKSSNWVLQAQIGLQSVTRLFNTRRQ